MNLKCKNKFCENEITLSYIINQYNLCDTCLSLLDYNYATKTNDIIVYSNNTAYDLYNDDFYFYYDKNFSLLEVETPKEYLLFVSFYENDYIYYENYFDININLLDNIQNDIDKKEFITENFKTQIDLYIETQKTL